MRINALIIILVLFTPCLSNSENYESYKMCRQCHSDIFKLWSGSLHAKSYTDPSFQAAYIALMLDEGEEAGRLCLRCHGPIAHLTDDFDLKSPSAAEGVTCWFCHSISSVNRGADVHNYYNLDTTGMLYGPHKKSSGSKHPLTYSPLHLVSELCAGCHEYTNKNGVGVLETFSEWSESPYPDNEVYCQNCHMPIMFDLKAVDSQEKDSYFATAHEFLGGHSNINLANAVKMETSIKRNGRRLDVKVNITNIESGHKLPTGIPVRKLVLRVILKSAYDSVEVSSVRKVYRKVLTDKYGSIIENVTDMFLNAMNIYSDNRIGPKETRVENMTFEIPSWLSNYFIETKLNNEYSRTIFNEEKI